MIRVLLTGFEPFAGASRNSSTEVIVWLRQHLPPDVTTEILPVEYQKSASRLLELIAEIKPEIVMSLGQAEGRAKISLERVAINLDDARIADNAGEIRTEREIEREGSPAYFTALPLRKIVDQLQARQHPVEVSLSAGSFVCNHLFYEAMRHLNHVDYGKEIWMDFVHLPLVDDQREEFPGKPTLSLEIQGRAILALVEEVRELYRSSYSL